MSSGFHHVAFACKDPEETRHFYEDLLGFPLIHTEIDGDETGGMKHLFFDLGDGSSMAFSPLKVIGRPVITPRKFQRVWGSLFGSTMSHLRRIVKESIR